MHMGAENFNLVSKFAKLEAFNSKFCIFGHTFSDKKKI